MSGIEAVVFDAYGTLFDVHSVTRCAEALYPGNGAALSQLWRSKQLEYSWLRSLMGRYENFSSVTRSALRFACRSQGLTLDDAAEQTLMGEYLRLSPFPEVSSALEALCGRRLAILSNGAPDMLGAVVAHAGLTSAFDAVLSVDPLRIFKPHPSVYALAVDRLAAPKERTAFVSSNFWDVTGATAFGFQTFWINRTGSLPDELGYRPLRELRSLTELAPALDMVH